MAENEYKRTDSGWFECLTCHFASAHKSKIERHMVKSHQHEPYPEPPILAEKFRKAKRSSKGGK